jgi:hypothetical protein
MLNNYQEKRKFVRFLISIPIKYAKLGLKQISNSSISDISAKGLGLVSAEELPVSSSLKLCLKMPDNGEEIPIEAEVVWSRCFGVSRKYIYGLRFKDNQLKPISLVLRTIQSRL